MAAVSCTISEVWFAAVAAPAGRGRADTLTGCVTPEPSTGCRPETRNGVFASMDDSEELAVLCRVAVAAPDGRGGDAAEIGCVVAVPSTFSAVIDAAPWTVRTSAEAVPAVPIAGCLAAVAAPDGRGKEVAETGCVA